MVFLEIFALYNDTRQLILSLALPFPSSDSVAVKVIILVHTLWDPIDPTERSEPPV